MREQVINFVTLLGILGIPTIFSLTVWCMRACSKFTRQLNILMSAQKAQMRSQLLEQYHYYVDDGWISEEHMEDWENQYKAYHELVGVNGVLDARRETLLNLPNRPQINISKQITASGGN